MILEFGSRGIEKMERINLEHINEYWSWDPSIGDYVTRKNLDWIENNGGIDNYPSPPEYDEYHPKPDYMALPFSDDMLEKKGDA